MNMILSFIVIFFVIIISGRGFNFIALLYLPIIMIAEYLLALSAAMLTSAITVYLRDIEYILGIISMAWQFLTPIMYPVEMVPERLRPLFNLNPMTPIAVAYRDILYYKQVPQLSTLVQGVGIGLLVLAIGIFVFEKLKRHFAEEL